MTYTVYVCSTVTGLNYGPLDCRLDSWARVLNGDETAQVTLIPDFDVPGALSPTTRDQYRAWTEPAQMALVVDWDGIALWGGPIWTRARSAGGVQINAGGLLSIFTRRKAVDASTTPYASQALNYSGISLGTIARRLVQFSVGETGGRLPIVYPQADESDSDSSHVRNYAGSDLSSISDLLGNLTNVINGPDIDFRPVWVDSARSAVQWQMVTGTQAAPQLTSGNQLAWEQGVVHGGVRDMQIIEDASMLVTNQWAKGSGSGTSTLMSQASSSTLVNLGWPKLEAETDYTTVTTQSVLDGHTSGDLAANAGKTAQWTLTVGAAEDPKLGTYQLGDLPTVHLGGDWWMPPGNYGMRIVGIAGSNSDAVQLTVQDASVRGLNIPGSPGQSLPARIRKLERSTRRATQ